ncbi:MAG: hypothetical protein M1546_06365 [Chloroflexi bacterium]|nr:hypothetical protein [Chloroflexota bacterium]
MNRLHIRYFIMAAVATAVLSALVSGLVVSLSAAATGAAFIGGWWTNLAGAGTVAILAGRKAAQAYTDPRLGRVAGMAVGLWVGAGAVIGEVIHALLVANWYGADVRAGLVIVFSLVSFAVSVIAAIIAGHETAHPPEEEEA